MRILHYALGFPPYRSGGLTKYCVDLMKLQKEDGHTVALLWPGAILITHKKTHIIRHKNWNGIENFELINPLPVALDEGILDVDAYIRGTQIEVFTSFFKEFKPDVIHIHTLMGLYTEFVEATTEMKIKTIFTSHDYYGICPKVTLFHNGVICNDMNCDDCYACNQGALSLNKIVVLQSPVYRMLKDTKLVKKLRKQHRKNNFDEAKLEKKVTKENFDAPHVREYKKLRGYYIDILNHVDIIHFNSSVAAGVYLRFLTPKRYEIISITHSDIQDNRRIKQFSQGKLKLTYLGPTKEFKGFSFLIRVLDIVYSRGMTNICLCIFDSTNVERPYIKFKQQGYNYKQLDSIFSNTDLLIAPSIWYETFGFVVLEALSYGVPVLVSDHVGAKDVIEKLKVDAVLPLSEEAFADAINEIYIDRTLLAKYNQEICSTDILPDRLPYEILYDFRGMKCGSE